MSGLLFLLALAVCLAAGTWVVRFAGRMVSEPKWKAPVMWGVALLLICAPFVDEVIGKYQFEALCKANGIESADVSKARGRRVRLEVGPSIALSGTAIPGTEKDWFYRDSESDEVVIHHKSYSATGGWLIRFTPLSMGLNRPMIFSGGCPIDYVDRDDIFLKNKITLIN